MKILVPYDSSAPARQALAHAVAWLQRTPGELQVLHVLQTPETRPPAAEIARQLELEIARELFWLVPAKEERDRLPVSSRVLDGQPARVILAEVARRGIDVVVMGTHGFEGLDRLVLGSIAATVLRRASCPVLCVREAVLPSPWRKVVCPVDFSDTSRRALLFAADLARRLGAELVLLHVYPGPGLHSGFLEAARALGPWKADAEAAGAPAVTTDCQLGTPAEDLLRAAREQGGDLIVMGTHGRTGLHHFVWGSVAETVVRRATIPVITVGPDGEAERRLQSRGA